MTPTCSNDCRPPLNFPRLIANRPGLSHIAFRIGAYSDFRDALLSALNDAPLLLPWTHRQPDDAGIALLEGVAIIGDILALYQELYANEFWLRTATWPESITALVRLLGYLPASGLGGQSTAAFEFKGAIPVTLPASFGFSAKLAGQPKPFDFETASALVAVPQLSRFFLYSPSITPHIIPGTTAFSIDTQELAAAGVSLKPKDQLALVDPYTVSHAQSVNWQIATVADVAIVLDRTVITLTGAWRGPAPSGGALTIYKLGRIFHAFGYNAPPAQISLTNNQVSASKVDTTVTLGQILQAFPLERKVDDLPVGVHVLVDLWLQEEKQSDEFLLVTRVHSASLGADTVGPLAGSVTMLALQGANRWTNSTGIADRRSARCLEVIGRGVMAQADRVLAPASTGLATLYYYGDGASYQLIEGRLLQFVLLHNDGSVAKCESSIATMEPSAVASPGNIALRPVYLNPALQSFAPADFALNAPQVSVFGNVVAVTQGKSQPATAVGNGDARQVNQTFALPKNPLTWLADETQTPPRSPEIQVLVNGIEWNQTASLFAAGPGDRNYILRLDDDGNTWIQFGDGIHGARLPSGVANVVVTSRSGVDANGILVPGTTPAPASTAQNLSAIRLYDTVVGGAAPESSSSARSAAPGRVQSLGRLVSLPDFEFEALALPGVEKALAVWEVRTGLPLLTLTVLLANPSAAATTSIQTAINTANTDRGSQRFSVQVRSASVLYLCLQLIYGLSQGYQENNVTPAIAAALGIFPAGGEAPSGGLFSQDQRQLGEPEYASRIEGMVQNVPGVEWVEVTAFDIAGSAVNPAAIVPPPDPALLALMPCSADQILAVYAPHFQASAATVAKGVTA